MTYFPDSSPYTYLTQGSEDLNVGWLSSEHPFSTGAILEEELRALVQCARRPERLCRGMHMCELCEEPAWVTVVQHDGHDVTVGNGEIRVQGPDQRWYAAPTMVVHYVVSHRYKPPQPFLDGAVERAKGIISLSTAERRALRELSRAGKYESGLLVLRSIASHLGPHHWYDNAIEVFEGLRGYILDGDRLIHAESLGRMDREVFVVKDVEGIPSTAKKLFIQQTQYLIDNRDESEKGDERMLARTANMIELARELGVSVDLNSDLGAG